MLQAVSPTDGYTLLPTPPIQLLDRTDADGPLIEAPSMTQSEKWYILFYSSDCYTTDRYTVSYAVAPVDDGNNGGVENAVFERKGVLLKTGDGNVNESLYAPGGATIQRDARNILWHADEGNSSAVRQLWAGEIAVNETDGSVWI
jgi:hypothetical protein